MSRVLVGDHEAVLGFPRVSGDEPGEGGALGDGRVFSPRERG